MCFLWGFFAALLPTGAFSHWHMEGHSDIHLGNSEVKASIFWSHILTPTCTTCMHVCVWVLTCYSPLLWCNPKQFIYLLLNWSNKVKWPGDILLRLTLPQTDQTLRETASHLQSCLCPPASHNPACPSCKVIDFHATAAATSDYQVAWLYSSILINHNRLPGKNSQWGTQIHIYVCQVKPVSEITTSQSAPPATLPPENTCTAPLWDNNNNIVKSNMCIHRFRIPMTAHIPTTTNSVPK